MTVLTAQTGFGGALLRDRTAEAQARTTRTDRSDIALSHPVDIFIGGCNDPRTRLVADYARAHAARHPHRQTAYFRQSQGRALLRCLRALPRAARITVIAHSWGVPTACRALARADRRVELLVGVDPVNRNPLGLFREPDALPDVRRILHVNAVGAAEHWDDGNAIARLGRFWCGGEPVLFRGAVRERIDAPFPHSCFAEMIAYRPDGGESAADIASRT